MKLLNLFLLFLFCCKIAAQGKLQGLALDGDNGHPIQNLMVDVEKDGRIFSTTTDDFGAYSTMDLDPGIYAVSFVKIGYTLFIQDVVIHSNMVHKFDVNIGYFEGINCSVAHYIEPLIQPWELSSMTHFMAKDLRRMPIR
jgi:Carboxypeptidase regulatory-like domain